jgi:hypothetical protein
MLSTRVARASGSAGMLAVPMILGGIYLTTFGLSGAPAASAGAEAWAAWAQREVLAIELGVYLILVPGLLLFLGMFAALASLLPADAVASRLAGYGAVVFVVLFAVAGVLASTTASTFDFYGAFEDPTAVTVYWGITAGYHLQWVGTWGLAMTILASAVGLRYSAMPSVPGYVASIVLVALVVAAGFFGFGVIFCLVWILAVSIGLLRWRPTTTIS